MLDRQLSRKIKLFGNKVGEAKYIMHDTVYLIYEGNTEDTVIDIRGIEKLVIDNYTDTVIDNIVLTNGKNLKYLDIHCNIRHIHYNMSIKTDREMIDEVNIHNEVSIFPLITQKVDYSKLIKNLNIEKSTDKLGMLTPFIYTNYHNLAISLIENLNMKCSIYRVLEKPRALKNIRLEAINSTIVIAIAKHSYGLVHKKEYIGNHVRTISIKADKIIIVSQMSKEQLVKEILSTLAVMINGEYVGFIQTITHLDNICRKYNVLIKIDNNSFNSSLLEL